MKKDIVLDARGLLCPKPVLKCKEFIEGNEDVKSFAVIVDNQASKENVLRFLKTMGFSVDVRKKEKHYIIKATRTSETINASKVSERFNGCELSFSNNKKMKHLVFITTDSIGHGDEKLGKKLMKNFLSTLGEMEDSLWRIILLNGGVKLATEESFVIEELKRLSDMGVSILVCGTCLDHFGLLDKKVVGDTTNMLDVITSLQLADKVIKI